MASLLGWIALTLQQYADLQMAVNVPSVMIILNSYILFMAAGSARVSAGAHRTGGVCLVACLCVFSAAGTDVHSTGIAVALFFAGTGLVCAWRLAFSQYR